MPNVHCSFLKMELAMLAPRWKYQLYKSQKARSVLNEWKNKFPSNQ